MIDANKDITDRALVLVLGILEAITDKHTNFNRK